MKQDAIGSMDQRVTFRSYTLAADGIGGQTKSWADVATVWANVRAGSGREFFEEDRVNASARVMITIRMRRDLDERMVARWNGVDYNIREIKDEGARDLYLRVMAERGVSQ